jgi:nucleotide-binding universal stress UspA family protein
LGQPAFGSIVCAIDPLAPSVAAARQAAALAGPSTRLTFLAVAEGTPEPDLEAALAAAERVAAEHGVTAASRKVMGGNAPEDVIESSAGADLLVVGTGTGDVLIGSTASAALHTAPLPVLIARSVGDAGGFPALILVATDGSPESRRGVELAVRIARAQGSRVGLIQVADGAPATGTLADDAAAVAEQLGAEPAALEEYGDAAARISEAARRERASLLVIGSRGLGRARVLGSVGERVAHEAPCSVLVLRESAL